MSWDVFAPLGGPVINMPEEARKREADAAELRAALGHPAGRAWLDRAIAKLDARPIYTPGVTLDMAAFREGQRQLLRDMRAAINQTPDMES